MCINVENGLDYLDGLCHEFKLYFVEPHPTYI